MGTGNMGTWRGFGQGPDAGSWATFGSRHTGVVQFAYADGSVHPLTRAVDYVNPWVSARPNPPNPQTYAAWWAFAEMAAYQDGLVANQAILAP
jgi:prepilin-type processing-associated H-X9-DG protein